MRVGYENVIKKYGPVLGVDRLHLEIRAGEFIVLLGPSGCGKTTTLRMLAGLENVTSGNIYIGEGCVNEVPPRDRDVAMVFQSYALYPHMTIAENIAYPLRVRRVPRHEIPGRVEKAGALLGIGDLLQRKPKELSGGQRQRVALARAIVRQPRVFLMDEPLSNLDAKLRVYMRGELKRLQYELGTTTLYVTHDQAEAMTLAHRVASERRFVSGDVTLAFRSHAVALPDGPARLVLGVRPEDVKLSVTQLEGGLPATVYVTEALGNETYVFLNLGKERIVARAGPAMRLDIESKVWISFDETKLHFFDPASGIRLP